MLETCLGITGRFEGGHGGPRYDLVTGNFDGAGLSVGCLQWNPGTGSIQKLLKLIFEKLGGCPVGYEDILALSGMSWGPQTVSWVVRKWIDTSTRKGVKGPLTSDAEAYWQAFMALEASVEAQQELAQAILDKAIAEASRFLPWLPEIDVRTAAFFFDLRTQQGGMSKKRSDGSIWVPDVLSGPEEADPQAVIDYASGLGKQKTAEAWAGAVADDPLAASLLHYAYVRASVARPEYVWDALSRRGTIACRVGSVHGTWVDLTQILP